MPKYYLVDTLSSRTIKLMKKQRSVIFFTIYNLANNYMVNMQNNREIIYYFVLYCYWCAFKSRLIHLVFYFK